MNFFGFIVVLAISYFVGVFGWAQIVGGFQNLKERGSKSMIQTDSGNYDERITSCNIKWDNRGLITGKSTHHVITDIFSEEI